MTELPLHLLRHGPEMAVARLEPGREPEWDLGSGPISSVARTPHETSVVCAAAAVPAHVRAIRGFTAFEVAGPLHFAVVGIVSSIVSPLASRGIPILSVSTFETVWVLVPGAQADPAQDVWRECGFYVTTTSLGRAGAPTSGTEGEERS